MVNALDDRETLLTGLQRNSFHDRIFTRMSSFCIHIDVLLYVLPSVANNMSVMSFHTIYRIDDIFLSHGMIIFSHLRNFSVSIHLLLSLSKIINPRT